jgi:hypothetical protein
MKVSYIIIGTIISLSCTNPTENKLSVDIKSQQDISNSTTLRQSRNSSKWTDNFLKIKKAITSGDRESVKSFIDFPIKNKENEIWYLADSKLVMEINPKEIKPFKEADFDNYFSSVFSLDLRRTLEKLNVEEFFKTNKNASPEIEVIKGSKSKLEATFDDSKHKIILALVTSLTGQANSKFTIYYQFDVLNDQNIKFRGVHVE